MFKATLGDGTQNDIALDDITLSSGLCPYGEDPKKQIQVRVIGRLRKERSYSKVSKFFNNPVILPCQDPIEEGLLGSAPSPTPSSFDPHQQ